MGVAGVGVARSFSVAAGVALVVEFAFFWFC